MANEKTTEKTAKEKYVGGMFPNMGRKNKLLTEVYKDVKAHRPLDNTVELVAGRVQAVMGWTTPNEIAVRSALETLSFGNKVNAIKTGGAIYEIKQ